jgi:GntR family transcriptional regulator, transcriptional repressor for pyruvate dehydrogenase complex
MIASKLRSEIAAGRLRPGDQLPGHREIAFNYGVSLGSAREAISMLVGDGLIETRAGRGTFVAEASRLPVGVSAPVTREEAEELIEAREVLGLSIVAMAAERASAEHVARLREIVQRMQDAASDAQAYPDADVEFHVGLAEAAGNRFLLRAMLDIRTLMRRDLELSAGVGMRRFGSLQFSVNAHRELVDSIEAGDPDDARRALLEIMSRHHEFVIGLYALAPPPSNGAA